MLPAWVADMDYDQAPLIKAAMTDLIERGDLGYNAPLLEALVPRVERLARAPPRARFSPEPEMRTFAGVLHCLEYVLTTCSEPGDGVVVFTPIYFPFRTAITDSGRRVVDVALGEGWTLDAERLEAAVDERTRVVLFAQPPQPGPAASSPGTSCAGSPMW